MRFYLSSASSFISSALRLAICTIKDTRDIYKIMHLFIFFWEQWRIFFCVYDGVSSKKCSCFSILRIVEEKLFLGLHDPSKREQARITWLLNWDSRHKMSCTRLRHDVIGKKIFNFVQRKNSHPRQN